MSTNVVDDEERTYRNRTFRKTIRIAASHKFLYLGHLSKEMKLRNTILFTLIYYLLLGAPAFADEFTCYEHGLELGPMSQKIFYESGDSLIIQISDLQLISFYVRTVDGVDFSGRHICLDYSKVETMEGTAEASSDWRSIDGSKFKILFHGNDENRRSKAHRMRRSVPRNKTVSLMCELPLDLGI